MILEDFELNFCLFETTDSIDTTQLNTLDLFQVGFRMCFAFNNFCLIYWFVNKISDHNLWLLITPSVYSLHDISVQLLIILLWFPVECKLTTDLYEYDSGPHNIERFRTGTWLGLDLDFPSQVRRDTSVNRARIVICLGKSQKSDLAI